MRVPGAAGYGFAGLLPSLRRGERAMLLWWWEGTKGLKDLRGPRRTRSTTRITASSVANAASSARMCGVECL
jgi:hypothetical protein